MVPLSMKGRVTKWVGLAASIWVQASAGNANTFPHYSPTLKSELQYNQVQLNSLGVAKDVGENVGLLAGLLCNLIPPWAILMIGALEGLLGYGILWLVISERIAPLPYWLLCVCLCVGANSTTWFNTAALVTSMRNFPNSRGTVVGIVKGFIGLSSAILTQIFVSFLGGDASDLLLFLAVGPAVVCVVVCYFIRPVPSHVAQQKDPLEEKHFLFIHVVCLALAIYLLVAIVAENVVAFSGLTTKILTSIMLAFLTAPLVVPVKCAVDKYFRAPREQSNSANGEEVREPLLKVEEQGERLKIEQPQTSDDEQGDKQSDVESDPENLRVSMMPGSYVKGDTGSPTTSAEAAFDHETEASALLAVGEGAVRRRKGPRRGEDFTLSQALVKADFWLLFFTFFCGVGTGVTAINNLGQIGQAEGYADVTVFVALVSVWNFLGRLGGGTISEYYVRKSALPRTVWMGLSQVVLIIGHLLFASAIPGSMHVGSALLGVCYGVHIAIMVPVASELFGLKHFGMIYNFMTMGNPIGSFLFSGLLAGYLYDMEAKKGESSSFQYGFMAKLLGPSLSSQLLPTSEFSEEAACTGAHCFRITFLVLAVMCMFGVILNVILTLRIRSVYLSLYGMKSRESSSATLKEQNGTSH